MPFSFLKSESKRLQQDEPGQDLFSEDKEDDMTEDEVNSIVHNALRQARRATTPKTSPRGSEGRKEGDEFDQPEQSKSWDSTEGTISEQHLEDESQVAGLLQPAISSPENHKESIVMDTSSPGKESHASSDDMIRRVEEEIEIAKKATEVAHQRVGNSLSPDSSNSWSIDEPKFSSSVELTGVLDQTDNSHSDIRDVFLVPLDEGLDNEDKCTTVTDTSFSIARDMITKEFGGDQETSMVEETNSDVIGEVEDPSTAIDKRRLEIEVTHSDDVQPSSSENSIFVGNVDETEKLDFVTGERVENPIRRNEDGTYARSAGIEPHKFQQDDPSEVRVESPVKLKLLEEKKEENPLSGPWNGLFSSLHTSGNAESDRDPAEVKEIQNSQGNHFRTSRSGDSHDFLSAEEDANEAGSDIPEVAAAPRKPWWTASESPEAELTSDAMLPSEKDKPDYDPEDDVEDEDINKEIDGNKTCGQSHNLLKEGAKLLEGEEAVKSPSGNEALDEERQSVQETSRDEAKLDKSRRIHFQEPYPSPTPLPQPRPAHEIVRDHRESISKPIIRWTEPKPQLQDLLLAAKGDSLTRRSNALGALKVLSLKKKNQLTLARTRGFLDAVVSVASRPIDAENEEIARVARARAVVTLLHISEPKDNRALVLDHPGLADCLVNVVIDDDGEGRAHACGALAMLAKTPANREPMVYIENLVSSLSLVVKGDLEAAIEEKTAVDVDESSDADSNGSASSADNSVVQSDEGSAARSTCSESSTKPTTKKLSNVHKSDSIRQRKDAMHEEFVRCGRYNACAALLHLSKGCVISSDLSKNETFLGSLMAVSVEFANPIHTKCLEILCGLTRFPANNALLARNSSLIGTLVVCGKSPILKDRVWAMRSFQNLSADSCSKLALATSTILTLLSISAVRTDYDEQVAAVATLYNLSTDAGAVVPMTNTKNVVASLVHLAHDKTTSDDIRQMACDALATIGLWLQTLASAGAVPAGVTKNVPLPSHATTGWERWE